jgi:D-alanyl-D-alanine carboxypeptidase (penicillin-binding protein 5/6)
MKHIIFFIFALICLALPLSSAHAQTFETLAREAIIMDYDTGTVLFEKNADQKMPTASMSKVMTVYAAFDALKSGKLSMDQQLPVSERAWRMQGSKMFIEVGKTVSVKDLLNGIIVQSGNDASVALAEGIAGSEEAFADLLNKKAKELGMNNSNFTNSSGWPDPNHYSTVRDLAIMARALIKNFPDHYGLYSQIDFTFNNIKQGNRNPLLYKNIGADGIKTGHTEEAGYGLIGSGVYQGRRVIIVVSGLKDMNERAEESTRILDWGMKNFVNKTYFKAGETLETVSVVMGEKPQVSMVIQEDIKFTMPRALADNVKANIRYMEPLEAGIQKGDKIGTLELSIEGREPITAPLYAGEDVKRLGLLAGTMTKFGFMLTRH